MKFSPLHLLGFVVALGGLALVVWKQCEDVPSSAVGDSDRATVSADSATLPRAGAGEFRERPAGVGRQAPDRARPGAVGRSSRDRVMAASEQDWECPEKGPLLRRALADWAMEDVEACAAWLKNLSPALAEALSLDAAGSLIADSALTAFLLLNELPPGAKIDEMMRQAAMELATADPEAARQWANSQSDSASSELLWSALATVMAEKTPESAISAAREHLADPAIRDRVTVEIIQRWMQNDVRAAADHVLTLEGGPGLAAAHAIAGYWCRSSPEQCESWIQSIASPEMKASAFSAFVDHRVLVDRAGVERLQAETADPGLRAILDQALGR